MEDPIRFDLWCKVGPDVPASAAAWLVERRPTLTNLAARQVIARARVSPTASLLLSSCSWSSLQALLGSLPNWIHDPSIVQEGYSPSRAPHLCSIHNLRYAGVLGCHVCRGSFVSLEADLTRRTRQQVSALFVSAEVDIVERALVLQCGRNLPGLASAAPDELERIRSAAIRLSAGSVHGLWNAIHLAEVDWRDLLVAAEFANDPTAHMHWQPRPLNAGVLEEWLARRPLRDVSFYQGDRVVITAGCSDERTGLVTSLEALEPEPRYLIELGPGENELAYQRHIRKSA